jgi:hypothetical protein
MKCHEGVLDLERMIVAAPCPPGLGICSHSILGGCGGIQITYIYMAVTRERISCLHLPDTVSHMTVLDTVSRFYRVRHAGFMLTRSLKDTDVQMKPRGGPQHRYKPARS